ncbi:MAG: hypothetical protein WD074_01810 [Candidatus Saccharimonadales bacterium]
MDQITLLALRMISQYGTSTYGAQEYNETTESGGITLPDSLPTTGGGWLIMVVVVATLSYSIYRYVKLTQKRKQSFTES